MSVGQLVNLDGIALGLLLRICYREIRRHIIMLADLYAGVPLPEAQEPLYLYSYTNTTWRRLAALSTKSIREAMRNETCLTNTKLFAADADRASKLYHKIDKIRNVPNKTKMIRLVHGDVYCGTRRKKFKMTENDLCMRCFQQETIRHLLLECSYTKQVWEILGLRPETPLDAFECQGQAEMEIRADIISSLVFRKQMTQPDILITATMLKYSNALCNNRNVITAAQNWIARHRWR
jgi:hypothetical protein